MARKLIVGLIAIGACAPAMTHRNASDFPTDAATRLVGVPVSQRAAQSGASK